MSGVWYVLLVLGVISWTVYGFEKSLIDYIGLENEPIVNMMPYLFYLGFVFFGVGGYIGIKQAWHSRK